MKSVKKFGITHVNDKSHDYNFGEGYPDKWDYFEAGRCSECGKIVSPVTGEDIHSAIEEVDCEGWITASGPMMDYFYPLELFGADPADEAKKLIDLPLCIVRFEDSGDTALVLTSGGMDLSWEICEAYMILGFLPPIHFAALSRVSGRGTSQRDRWILAGCRASFRWLRDNCITQLQRLKGVK